MTSEATRRTTVSASGSAARPQTTAGRGDAASVDRRRVSERDPESSAGADSGTAEGRRERRVRAGSVTGASEDNRQAGSRIVSRGATDGRGGGQHFRRSGGESN